MKATKTTLAPVLAAAALAAGLLGAASYSQAQQAPSMESAAPVSGAYKLDPSHGKITWSVSHLGFSTYTGQFINVAADLKLDAAKPANSTLSVTIPMATAIASNDTALNEHLAAPGFFDVAKYPTATFKSTSVVQTGANTADVAGDLTLHGVTKPVTLKVHFNRAGPHPMTKKPAIGFDAETTIKRSDFGMGSYVPMISDEVKLVIEAEFAAS